MAQFSGSLPQLKGMNIAPFLSQLSQSATNKKLVEIERRKAARQEEEYQYKKSIRTSPEQLKAKNEADMTEAFLERVPKKLQMVTTKDGYAALYEEAMDSVLKGGNPKEVDAMINAFPNPDTMKDDAAWLKKRDELLISAEEMKKMNKGESFWGSWTNADGTISENEFTSKEEVAEYMKTQPKEVQESFQLGKREKGSSGGALQKVTATDDDGNVTTHFYNNKGELVSTSNMTGMGKTKNKPKDKEGLTPIQEKTLDKDIARAEEKIISNPEDEAVKPTIDLFNKWSDKPYMYIWKDEVVTKYFDGKSDEPAQSKKIDLPVKNGRQLSAKDIAYTAEEEGKTIEEVLEAIGALD